MCSFKIVQTSTTYQDLATTADSVIFILGIMGLLHYTGRQRLQQHTHKQTPYRPLAFVLRHIRTWHNLSTNVNPWPPPSVHITVYLQ